MLRKNVAECKMSSGANAAQGRWGGHLCGQTYLSDLDLDRSVVLGGNESVRGRALSGDIDIHNISFVVLHLY